MRVLLPFYCILLAVVITGCATAMDMDAVTERVNDNTRRIAALEKAQAGERGTSDTARKVQALESELDALRREFADSRWTVGQLAERVESLRALMEEVQQSMGQLRMKGGEIDRALEQLTNRLEADVRTLADKLRQMLDSEAGN